MKPPAKKYPLVDVDGIAMLIATAVAITGFLVGTWLS